MALLGDQMLHHSRFRCAIRRRSVISAVALTALTTGVGVHALAPPANAAVTVDGMIDLSFGTRGEAPPPNVQSLPAPEAVTIDASGRLLVAGSLFDGARNMAFVARYTANGAADTGFGVNGVSIGFDAQNYRAQDVATDTSGRILVAGISSNGTREGVFVARFTDTGAPDTTFGFGDGVLVDFDAGTDSQGLSLALQSDGKILLAGKVNNGSRTGFLVARYTTAGAPDPSYGESGLVTDFSAGVGSEGSSIVVDAEGKAVVAGMVDNGSRTGFGIARYTTSGTPDSSFGSGGLIADYSVGALSNASSVTLDGSDRVVVAGSALLDGKQVVAVARYIAGGAPDTSFSVDGVHASVVAGNEVFGESVVVDAANRVVVAGTVDNGQHFGFALLRLNPAGAPDVGFGLRGDGYVFDVAADRDAMTSDVAVDGQSRLVVAGGASGVSRLARYATATTPAVRTGVSASALSDRRINVVWGMSDSDGGTPLTGFIATTAPGGQSCSAAFSATSCVIGGLSSGTTYAVSVTATNALGTSADSVPVYVTAVDTLPEATVPRVVSPTFDGLRAVPYAGADGLGAARLSWRLPAGVVASTVQVVVSSPGARTRITMNPERTAADVTGLPNNSDHSVHISALTTTGGTVQSASTLLRSHLTRLRAASTTVKLGQPSTLMGVLYDGARRPRAGQRVDVLIRVKGAKTWRGYRSLRTSGAGLVRLVVRPTSNTEFALRFSGTGEWLGSVSDPVGVNVVPKLSATLSTARAHRGTVVTMRGVVAPATRGVVVILQRLDGRTWRNITSTRTNSAGSYAFTIRASARRAVKYRTRVAPTQANLAATSPARVLTGT